MLTQIAHALQTKFPHIKAKGLRDTHDFETAAVKHGEQSSAKAERASAERLFIVHTLREQAAESNNTKLQSMQQHICCLT